MALSTFVTISDADAPYEVRETAIGRFVAQVKAPKSGDGKATWTLELSSGHYMAGGYAVDLAAAQVAAREAADRL